MDRILKSILSETPRGREYLAAHKQAKRDASARRRSRSPRASGATRADRKAAMREETARIRTRVDARDPVCIVCLEPAAEPWHMHHVDSGSGKTERQTVENCCKTHEPCHKRLHRGDLDALRNLLGWAVINDYSATMAVIERRIDKIYEARRIP